MVRVAVVGAGVCGASAALQLAADPAVEAVHLFDQVGNCAARRLPCHSASALPPKVCGAETGRVVDGLVVALRRGSGDMGKSRRG